MSGITAEFWEVLDPSLPLVAARYGSNRARMVLVGLGDGRLVVVSPGALPSAERWAEVERWGTPAFFLAPNHFHNSGLGAWRERFPGALLVADPRAHARLAKKVPGATIADLAPLQAALPSSMWLKSPPGATQGETWLSLQSAAGRTWLVCDGLVNEERLPPGAIGLFMRAIGFRPGLMVNPLFKRLFLKDKAVFKAWLLAELSKESPTLLVLAHGAVLSGPELAERMRVATSIA